MNVLGIETSCDDTCAAVVQNGNRVLSNIISSQIELHNKTGGVVPEVASREHIKDIIPVIDRAVLDAGIGWDDIDLISVTVGPGLVGALLIGVETAKAIAYAKDKKIVGINHITGHIYSSWLDTEDTPKFPILALTVSGGHNHLVLIKGHHDFEILGKTRDDASGEAFDKVARMLGLSYPGGPIISKMALNGDKDRFNFPRSYLEKGSLDFSFSGLKTAVNRQIADLGKLSEQDVYDVCASFQESVVDILVEKIKIAMDKNLADEIHLVGGVSANRRLREVLNERVSLKIRTPNKISYCTDNAAMIAESGFFKYMKDGEDNIFDLKVDPKMHI